jgi:hypothetical protein
MVLLETLIRMEDPSVLVRNSSHRLVVHSALMDATFTTFWSGRSFSCFAVREPEEAMIDGLDAGSRSGICASDAGHAARSVRPRRP